MKLFFRSASYEALKDFEAKKKLVIVKSASDEVFCAGDDVTDIAMGSLKKVKSGLRSSYRSFHLIATYKIPYIALISGVTGSSVLSMSAKYRVATEKTIFSTREAQLGFFNSSGASFFLSRLNDNVGIYMGLTGARIKGQDVKNVGLASHFVETKNLRQLERNLSNCENENEVENILEEFSFQPTTRDPSLDENLARIKKCFGGLTVEQIVDNLKSDESEWAGERLQMLQKMSPTSLKVCHRLMNLGRHMSLEDCAKLEWRLGVHFSSAVDLQEGYRARFVDRDMKPIWNPPVIEEVTDYNLSRFFGPLADEDELTFEIKRSTEGHYVE